MPTPINQLVFSRELTLGGITAKTGESIADFRKRCPRVTRSWAKDAADIGHVALEHEVEHAKGDDLDARVANVAAARERALEAAFADEKATKEAGKKAG